MFFSFRKTAAAFLILLSVVNAQEKVKLSSEYAENKLPFGLVEKIPVVYPKIALALSGGGSRGIAHLGVLKALEENKIPFSSIYGTSMGSIIGGMYAAGYNITQIDSIVRSANWDSFFSLKELNRKELFVDQKITEEKAIFAVRLDGFNPVLPSSINTGQRVANFLNLITLFAPIHVENSFADLLYNYRAISTDFVTGDMVVMDRGSLSQAMRASSGVTLLLPPMKKDEYLLVDGGLVANIPVKPARADGAELIIASDTSSPLNPAEELNLPWSIADQMVSIPMKILNEQQLKEADVVIEPGIGYLKNTDFSKIDTLISEGYNAAMQNVEFIKAKIKETAIKKRGEPERYFTQLALAPDATEYEKQIFANLKSAEMADSRELLYELSNIYMSGDFETAYIEIIPADNKNILKVITKENPVVSSVVLTGISLVDEKRAENIFASVLNKPYNSRKIINAILGTLSLYRTAGYPFASVKVVSFNRDAGTLAVAFDEVKINQLEITGNVKTEASLITREFEFENGNIKFDAIQRGLVNLRATNIFEDVEVYPHSENGINKLRVDVKEKLSTVLRLGLRIDNEYQTQMSLDLRDENFMGTGAEFGFIFSGGTRARSFMLEHKSNRVFDSYLTYKLKAFYDITDINVYSEDSTVAYNRFSRNKTAEYSQSSYGISIGLGSQVGRFGNLLLETKYQTDRIKNNSDYKGPEDKIGILGLRLTLTIDSQNKYPFPTEGFLVKAYYETAQSILGSDIGYTKLFFDYRSIYSIDRLSTFTARFVIGAADNTLPLSQNFSLGGQNSFYGMREYEFRGRQILLGSLEYRFLLPFNLFFDTYIKARYDIGSIWSIKDQIRFKDLRHGIGTALAFDTPVGPAEFAVGESFYFKNNLTKSTIVLGDPYFYFSIGYSF
jgi:NTE family protein